MHPAFALTAGLALAGLLSGCGMSPVSGPAASSASSPAATPSASPSAEPVETTGSLDLDPSTGSGQAEPDQRESGTPQAATTPVPSANLEPVLYYQFDEAWAKQPYGPDATDTVRRWACGPADMAMVVATLRDTSVDVADASAWAQQNGYFTNKQLAGKTKDSFFADYGDRYGVRVVQVNSGDLRTAPAAEAGLAHEEALQAVKGGDWVIALMGVGPWTTEAHYVLWYDAPGDEVLIRDSNSKKAEKARNKHSLFIQTVQRYWIVDVDRSGPAA